MKRIAAGLYALLLAMTLGASAMAQTQPPPAGQPAPTPSNEMPITEYGIGALAALIILAVVCFPEARE